MVIVGDSHPEQFSGALIPLAQENNWQPVSLLLGGWDFGSGTGNGAKCRDFNKAAMDYILNLKPDAVFTVATDAVPDSPEETIIPGYEQAVQAFTEANIEVSASATTPAFLTNKASCVAKSGADESLFQQSAYLAGSNPAESLNESPAAHMIDLTDQY
ncbi:SGNH hydrolase domain-containing protein [Specibacter sp. NPDC078692]|uniref:SGNH hydrolase domain-containing protein n=1 Tax=Specibacter sp. NPDC078692 TaxID=3155818 RepID=UPI00343A23A2